jgi:pyrroline-5-carboxylate reductase
MSGEGWCRRAGARPRHAPGRATVEEARALLRGSSSAAAELRESVTSKGGTTAAALAVLMGPQGLEALLTRAVAAAAARSRELSD